MIIQNNQEKTIKCPTCKRTALRSSKYNKKIPKHYNTYYCEKCGTLTYQEVENRVK